jgi:hypothetical protein
MAYGTWYQDQIINRRPMRTVNIAPITRLTHDRKTSIRLFMAYQKRYPNQSPQWVLEKVVEDLLRDRGVDVPRPLGPLTRKFPVHWRPRGAYSPISTRQASFTRLGGKDTRNHAHALVLIALLILASVGVAVARQAQIQTIPSPTTVSPGSPD